MSDEEAFRSPDRQRRRIDTNFGPSEGNDQEVITIEEDREELTNIRARLPDADVILNLPEEKKLHVDGSDEEDGLVCSICFEPWTTAGSHRVSCLSCGHLYGKRCIEKWITSAGREAVCPQCKVKTKKQDVRPLFVSNLRAVDNTELERTQKTLDRTREELRKTELAHANALALLRTRESEVQKLRTQITLLKESIERGDRGSLESEAELEIPKKWNIAYEKSIEMNKDGGCRLLAYDGQRVLVTTQPVSQNRLFKGYGIRKLCSVTFTPSKFYPLHDKPITDMAFNPERFDQLVTVSTDKHAKLTDMHRNVEVQKFALDFPLTSTIWNYENPNQFYVGMSTGHISLFDIRKPGNDPVERITENEPQVTSPVYGMAYVPRKPRGGLLVLRLKQFSFYEFLESKFAQYVIPVEDPFNSLSYEASSRHVLVTTKPSVKHPQSRHFVSSPNDEGAPFSPDVTFSGSTKMRFLSKSCLFVNPNNSLTVASSLETANCIALWDCSSGKLSHTLPLTDGACDLLPFSSNGASFLGALTEHSLNVYKWQEMN